MKTPLVSIFCEAYNHERFLRDCLNGFVMQQTDYPFEVLIHDDASTDNSASIIKEYADQYPDLIFPIFQTENKYSQGIGIRNHYQYPRAKGKYIAICEGDDYWTDPLKLQKQVAYMEAHPDCSLCFGNAMVHWEDNDLLPDKPYSEWANKIYDDKEILWDWRVPTATFLFRRDVTKSPLFQKFMSDQQMVVDDLPLFLTCAKNGYLYAFSDYFSVYRKHGDSFTMNVDADRRRRLGEMWEKIPVIFGKKYTDISFFYAVINFRRGMKSAINEGNLNLHKSLKKKIIQLYVHHPKSGMIRVMKIIKERCFVKPAVL